MAEPEDTRRVEELTERGHARLREDDPDGALEVARELESLRSTAAFEIAALAHAARGETEEGIAVLRRGLDLAGGPWLNRQLLGNLLSDADRPDEAEEAFLAALEHDDVWASSVHLNRAILRLRRGAPEEALRILDRCDDPDLALRVADIRVASLRALARIDEAAEAGRAAIEAFDPETAGPDDRYTLGRLLAQMGWIGLGRGADAAGIRASAVGALESCGDVPDLLAVIRDADGRFSPDARYLRLLVHARVPPEETAYDIVGFYRRYDVVAENAMEALEIVRDLEPPWPLSVEEVEDVEPRPDEPMGVYRRSGRHGYVSEGSEEG
jgi:tetratricopeptide (TPR) repeat protein